MTEKIKPLHEIMIISDQMPEDFHTNSVKYLAQLSMAIGTANDLVYELSDEGRSTAKKDVALIRKYATTTDKFRLSVFRSLTEKAKAWSDSFTTKTKELNVAADAIMYRFNEMESAKLDEIMDIVQAELVTALHGIRPEFCGCTDVSPLIKLSGTITPGGKLTTKAIAFITEIAMRCKAAQDTHDNRVNIVKIRCLEADINPPLSSVHFGTVFAASDEIFNAKLEELIDAEITRRKEMEERIIKQQEAQKQREIAAAIMEAGRKAAIEQQARDNELLEKSRQEDFDKQAALNHERSKQNVVIEKPIIPDANSTAGSVKIIRITATFEITVPLSTSTERVKMQFQARMTDAQKQTMKNVEVVND